MKKNSLPNPVESLGFVKCYSSSRPGLIKTTLEIISDTSVKRSAAVDREDLKPYWEPEKRHISLGDLPAYTKHRNKFNRTVVFSRALFPTFLNTGITGETFQLSRKQDSFRHILKESANMYESSGSQFFKTTTGIQSGPDTFDKSSLVMTF